MAFASRLQLYSLNIGDKIKPCHFCITENGADGVERDPLNKTFVIITESKIVQFDGMLTEK